MARARERPHQAHDLGAGVRRVGEPPRALPTAPQADVDQEIRAGDIAGAISGEQHYEARDLLRLGESAGRRLARLLPRDRGGVASDRSGDGLRQDGGRYAFMRRVLETETGRALYGKRQEMTEPIFANAKFNHRIDASYAADRAACRSEWRLITATRNLLKLHTDRVGAELTPTPPTPPGVRVRTGRFA